MNAKREAWKLLEPIHALTYFSPEPLAALREAGYRGYWMGYFAGRAAPLGRVGPDVVHALFYNFSRERVAKALPDAWEYGAPAAALDARLAGSVAALRRHLGPLAEGADLERAAELAASAAAAADTLGRPLAAANQALEMPDEPLARLWQAATTLREQRGDGHIAALLTAGIEGREAHVLHSLAIGNDRAIYTAARGFEDAEWAACLDSLERKGLVSGGTLTDEGHAAKEHVEDLTDRLAADIDPELIGLLRPLTSAVVQGGDIPLDAPMGLDLRELVVE